MTDFMRDFNDAIQAATQGQTNTQRNPTADLSQYVAGGANITNLDSNFYVALSRLIANAASNGHSVSIGDGWRDNAVQAAAYDHWRRTGRNLNKTAANGYRGDLVPSIARPGRSHHEVGLAADIEASTAAGTQWLHDNAGLYGISFNVRGEPWHAAYTGAQSRRTMGGQPVPGWDTFNGSSPQQSDYSPGTGGQGQGGAGMDAVTGDTSGNAVAASVDTFSGLVPKDLVVLNVPGQERVIGYDMGNGVWGIWDGPSVSLVNNARVVNVDAAAYEQLRTVRLGDVSELDDLAGSYDTFREFFEEWTYIAGIDEASLADPGVAETFLRTIGDPSLLAPENRGVIERMLQDTDWFQDRTSRQLQWNDGSLSRAQKDQFIDDETSKLQSEIYRYIGENVAFNDPRLREWAERVASGSTTIAKLISTEIKPMAEGRADSPWSRTLRDEQRSQRQRGVDYEDAAARIRATAVRWGVSASDEDLLEWGRKLTEGIYSNDDITEMMKDQAQALYPWKSREIDTATAAQPYIQAYNSTYEVSGTDVFSADIQRAMQSGMTVTDFAQELRNDDRWMQTEQARDSVLSIGSQISRQMGFD